MNGSCFYIIAILWALAEIMIAKKNETKLLENGAKEHGQEIFTPLAILYIGTLLLAPVESFSRGGGLIYIVAGIFFISKLLKIWVISTLRGHWAMKILSWPSQRVYKDGPYKFMRHPNYVIMMIEIPSYCLAGHAWITALISAPIYLYYLRRKAGIENNLLYERVSVGE